MANGANNPSGGSGQLLSALRAARVDVASYDPNAPRPPRAQSAPAPMPRFVRFLNAPNTRFIFASSGSVNANTTATQQVPVTPEPRAPLQVVSNNSPVINRQPVTSAPESNNDAPITKREVQALFADFTASFRSQLSSIPDNTVQSPVTQPPQPPVLTPAHNDPVIDYSHRSPPRLSPVKATPVKETKSVKSNNADKPKENTRRHCHSDDVTSKSVEANVSAPMTGPMGATPLKKHSRKAYKRSYTDDSSPSPSDSGSDSDYGKRRAKKAKSGALRTYSDRVKFTFRC